MTAAAAIRKTFLTASRTSGESFASRWTFPVVKSVSGISRQKKISSISFFLVFQSTPHNFTVFHGLNYEELSQPEIPTGCTWSKQRVWFGQIFRRPRRGWVPVAVTVVKETGKNPVENTRLENFQNNNRKLNEFPEQKRIRKFVKFARARERGGIQKESRARRWPWQQLRRSKPPPPPPDKNPRKSKENCPRRKMENWGKRKKSKFTTGRRCSERTPSKCKT